MNPVMKAIAKVHTAVYKISGGRLGSAMGGQDILLLHHVGAKSGKRYTTPLGYVKDGDAYVVIAAAMGQPNHPGWYHNLKKSPETTITVAGKQFNVTAEVVPQERRDKIWAELSASLPQFDQFQGKTSRVIPAIFLHPKMG